MTPAAPLIEGVVLCRVGPHRLAVHAQEVTAFDAFDGTAPYAGAGFDAGLQAPGDARVLRHHATRLAVDSVEVRAEQLPLLAVPSVMAGVWGGALAGFVETAGALWPVVRLSLLAAEPEAAS